MKLKHILLAALTVLAACTEEPQISQEPIVTLEKLGPILESNRQENPTGRTQTWPCPDWQTWRMQATSEDMAYTYYPYRRKVYYQMYPYMPHRADGGNNPVTFTLQISNTGNVGIEYLNGANWLPVAIGGTANFTKSIIFTTPCGTPAPNYDTIIIVRMTGCAASNIATNFQWKLKLIGLSSGQLDDGGTFQNQFIATSTWNPGTCSLPY